MSDTTRTHVLLNNPTVIVGVDIGTTKVAMVAGIRDTNHKIQIVGFGKSRTKGVDCSLVLNIGEVSMAIREALSNCIASSNGGLEYIQEVYVGISGQHIKSEKTTGEVIRENPQREISVAEIEKMCADQKRGFNTPGYRVIRIIPQRFYIDGRQTPQPVGCNGHRIVGHFLIVAASERACENIRLAVEKAGLRIIDFELQPLASAHALVTQENAEGGVVVLDIGGGTTDIAIFKQNILEYTTVLPMGGASITKDIKSFFSIPSIQAESLKIQLGSAQADNCDTNKIISVPMNNGNGPREVPLLHLANVIEGRMSTILDLVYRYLKQIGFDPEDLWGGIILTGGGAMLRNLLELVAYKTGLMPQIGYPSVHIGGDNFPSELNKPEYATCIGIILRGFEDYDRLQKSESVRVNIPAIPPTYPTADPTPVSEPYEQADTNPNKTTTSWVSHIWNFFTDIKNEVLGEEEDEEKEEEEKNTQ